MLWLKQNKKRSRKLSRINHRPGYALWGSVITEDGEAIEGESADEVEVIGRVTFFINGTDADDVPV